MATSGTLNAPTNLVASATIGSSTVNLTWNGSTLSTGTVAQGYYATRTRNSDGSTSAACGSSATNLIPATSCADSAVPDGLFHYTVTAVYLSWTAVSASSGNVTVRTASKLAFTTAPSSTATSGTALATQPVVTVQDVAGVTIATDTSTVTLTLTTPSGASLVCAVNPKAAASGVASFTGCAIDKVGTYTLTATDGSLGPATSTSVAITAGAPATVTVGSGSAQSASVGAGFAGLLVAQVTDAYNNPVGGATVTFTAPAAGASGTFANGTRTTTAVTGVNGQATSSVFSANAIAGPYSVAATAGSGSAAFTMTNNPGAAAKLAISSTAVSGSASATANLGAITVERQDSFGNPASPASALTVNLASSTLGAKVFATTSGGASVTSVVIPSGASSTTFWYGDTRSGSPLITASGTLTSATQIETITAAAASQLAFGQQSTNTVAGVAISPSPTVQILDQFGNLTTSVASVTMAIGTNPSLGTLSGTKTVNAVNGVATFATLSINKAGTGYTLTAASPALTGATGGTFNISAAAASQLAFGQQSTNTVAGVAISPSPTVQILDQFGNLTTSVASVTVAIGTNPSSGTLSGTKTVNAVNGVATFSTLSINKAGTGYTLTATSGALTVATGGSFNISAAAASQLAFVQQPSDVKKKNVMSPVTVQVLDQFGNLTSSTASLTLAIGTNPASPTPGILSGTLTVNATNGVATFSTLQIDKAGNGYTLTATSGGLTGTTSSTFNITP